MASYTKVSLKTGDKITQAALDQMENGIASAQEAADSAAGAAPTADTLKGASDTGKSLLKASDAGAARSAIGAGTSNLALGTTATTAMKGDYKPAWGDISGKPTIPSTAGLAKQADLDAAITRIAALEAAAAPEA